MIKKVDMEKIKEKAKPLSPKYQNIYYVYICKVDGIIKYVGMGKGKRLEHCTSGKSSCSELNRDKFEGKVLEVEKVAENLSQSDAQSLEIDLIRKYDGLYNKRIDYDLSSTPNVKRMANSKIVAKDTDDKLIKSVCSLSPEITKHSFKELKSYLSSCGLDLFLVQFGDSKPVLVVDKPEHSDYEIRHLGCFNWPNCSTEGCGEW
jgi:hypothetical protein